MALQGATGSLVSMINEDTFEHLQDFNPPTYVEWAHEIVIIAQQSHQRNDVSRIVVDELIKHAKFWGTKLQAFIFN